MALTEHVKKVVEMATGLGCPRKQDLPELIKAGDPRLYRFDHDGKTPNNSNFPL